MPKSPLPGGLSVPRTPALKSAATTGSTVSVVMRVLLHEEAEELGQAQSCETSSSVPLRLECPGQCDA